MTKRNSKSRENSSTVTLSTDILRTAMNAFTKLPMAKKHESLHLRSADPHTLELQVNAAQESLRRKIEVEGILPQFDEIEVCTASISAALARCDMDSAFMTFKDDGLVLEGCFIPTFHRGELEDNMIWVDEDEDEYYDCSLEQKLPARFFDILALAAPFAVAEDGDSPDITLYEDCIVVEAKNNLVTLKSAWEPLGIIPLQISNPAAFLATGYRGKCVFRYSRELDAAQFCAGPWTWTTYECFQNTDYIITRQSDMPGLPEMQITLTLNKKDAKPFADFLSNSGTDVDVFAVAGDETYAYFTTGYDGCMIPACKNKGDYGFKAHIRNRQILSLLRMGCIEFGFSYRSTCFTAKGALGECVCELEKPTEMVFHKTSRYRG